MSKKQPKCGICKHEQRKDIDAALSVDHVIAQVARRFGAAESPLRRHRDQGHHREEVVAGQPPAATGSHRQPLAEPETVPESGGGDGEPEAHDDQESPLGESDEGDEEEQEAEPSAPPPAAWSAPLSRPLPANESAARSYLQANTLDAALGRAQMSVEAIRKTESVVAPDGRKYQTARTTDIVRVGRAALLAEGLVLTQVGQTIKYVGRWPVLEILYLLRYVRTNPAQTEYIELDMPLPSDKTSDVHFRTSSASTYALRLLYKRILQAEEQEDDKDVLLPSIPASEPDPWGIVPEAPISENTRAEQEQRLRDAHTSPALPPGTDALVAKQQKASRGREYAKRNIQRKEAAAASSRGHEDISERKPWAPKISI